VLQEIRQRKEASRYAYEESQRLERALAGTWADGRTAGRAFLKAGVAEPRSSTRRQRPRAARGSSRRAILAVVQGRAG
jgi:hypothetical protein